MGIRDRLGGHKKKYEDIGRDALIKKLKANRERLGDWVENKDKRRQAVNELSNLVDKSVKQMPEAENEEEQQTVDEASAKLEEIKEDVDKMQKSIDAGTFDVTHEEKFKEHVDYLTERSIESLKNA